MKTIKIKTGLVGFVAVGLIIIGGKISVPVNTPAQPKPDHETTIAAPSSDPVQAGQPNKKSSPSVKQKNLQNAPKQAEIRGRVSVEHVYHTLATANDPLYTNSWALQKSNAPSAWNVATGNDQTVVAVIDTGFALNHEDLNASWKTNIGEVGDTQNGGRCWVGSVQNKQTNNCDDDNNGYVDDWRGWNFSSATNNPQAGQVNQTGSAVAHGTAVAGLVGARGNNGVGIATIDWSTKLMPLQALDDGGTGYTSDITAAVYYAVDNGANVINMSLGGSEFDQSLSAAITYAFSHNVVVVAAAGNCGTGNESGCNPANPGVLSYPATENHVISVGATNQSDLRASFSSNGQGLDVVAPGSGTITSTSWSSSNQTAAYATSLNGTSFASPQVASLAALIKSIRSNTTVDDITGLILGTSTKVSGMSGQFFTAQYGHGLINASSAIAVASSLNATTPNSPTLAQTGGIFAEHLYASNELLASGCQVTIGTYCTVWMKNSRTGFDRYLPYVVSNSDGKTGWNWNSSGLGTDNWNIRAAQGESISSTPYQLIAK